MVTLTEAAYYTRRILKFIFLALIALIFLRMVIFGISSVWRGVPRPTTVKPDVAFGKLSPIKFPTEKAPTELITYTSEFVGGVVPEGAASARVYFMPPKPSQVHFFSLERANEFAKNLGFKAEPVALSQTLYQWTDPEFPLRILQRDIVTGNFRLSYDFYKDSSALSGKDLPYGKSAISEAMNFLGKRGLSSPDFEETGVKTSFWKATGSELLSVPSVSEADVVRVDLFRSPIDNLSLVTPSYKEALVYFLLSGSPDPKRILIFNYIFQPVERGIFATYPLKTTQEAWNDLEEGRGYVANWGAVKGTHVTIRRVHLAYYDSEVYQPYLQPVFVFEGDGGFMAYVSAITKGWVE